MAKKKPERKITKSDAANAISDAFENLLEAQAVRNVLLSEAVDGFERSVLERIANTKVHDAFHAVEFANTYFDQ